MAYMCSAKSICGATSNLTHLARMSQVNKRQRRDEPIGLDPKVIIAVLKFHELDEYRLMTKGYLIDTKIFKITMHDTILHNTVTVSLECKADEETCCEVSYDYDMRSGMVTYSGWSFSPAL